MGTFGEKELRAVHINILAMPTSRSDLSPRGALAFGLLTIAAGLAPILGTLGVWPLPLTQGTPAWVGLCAGIMFVLAGLAVINGYAFGGLKDDRDTSGRVRIQSMLGSGICGMLAAVAGWVGFGPGARRFSTSFSLPFLTSRVIGSESMGRAAFGGGAVLAAIFAIVFLVRALDRVKP
jgi:hypothetical protein